MLWWTGSKHLCLVHQPAFLRISPRLGWVLFCGRIGGRVWMSPFSWMGHLRRAVQVLFPRRVKLAVLYGMDKYQHYMLGCPKLYVQVNHKPLVGLFNSKSIFDIYNPRLHAIREKLLRWEFQTFHLPGVQHKAPDATSLRPLGDQSPGCPPGSPRCLGGVPMAWWCWRGCLGVGGNPSSQPLVDAEARVRAQEFGRLAG